MLSEFSEKQSIPYPLLSDVDSDVIRRFGILNDSVPEDDPLVGGIPYPGVYVTDEHGVVVQKFFHDSYKKRDSPELLIDAALGRIVLDDEGPSDVAEEREGVRVGVHVHGGRGTVRQGIRRHLVVRFELSDGLHIYGEPVPEGMVATSVEVSGPDGLVVEEASHPPTETLRLEAMDVELQVWSGTVDIVLPIYAVGELMSETRPNDVESVPLEVKVRYQACDDQTCLLPRTETFHLELEPDVIDVPNMSTHMGHGQREANYDGMPHLRRLLLRKIRKNPMGLPRFLWRNVKLEMAARRRARSG